MARGVFRAVPRRRGWCRLCLVSGWMKLAPALAISVAVTASGCSGSKGQTEPTRAAEVETAAAAIDAGPRTKVEAIPFKDKSGMRAWKVPTTPVAEDEDDALEPQPLNGHNQEAARTRFKGDTPLYVDGKLVAAVRYWELPPWLPTHIETLGDGRKAERFVFAHYLRALGIDTARIKEVHLHGGRGRVAITTGAELAKVADVLLFSFTMGDSGKMRMHWGPKFEVTDTIDKVERVNIYVTTKPPAWSMRKMSLVDDKGEPLADPVNELRGSVRVYLDGRIAFLLKRKEIGTDGTLPSHVEEEVPYYRLFDYLRVKGIDPSRVVALELFRRDELLARLDGKAKLFDPKEPIEFSAAKKQGGQITIHYRNAAGTRDVMPVTAIALFTARRAKAKHRR